MPRVTENSGDVRTGEFLLELIPKKKPVRKIRTGYRVGKWISCVREGRNPRRRVSFRRHYRPDCRHPRRYSWGSARNRSATEPSSSGSVQSRSGTAPSSCGSVRNKIAAASTNVWVADCRSAAANCRGYCCRPDCPVAFAAGDCKNARCLKSRDCRRRACCRMPAAAARKSGRCWKGLGGCYCSLASKAARPGRPRLQTANRRVPMVDDSHYSCPLFAWVGPRGDSRLQNPLAGGHYH